MNETKRSYHFFFSVFPNETLTYIEPFGKEIEDTINLLFPEQIEESQESTELYILKLLDSEQ